MHTDHLFCILLSSAVREVHCSTRPVLRFKRDTLDLKILTPSIHIHNLGVLSSRVLSKLFIPHWHMIHQTFSPCFWLPFRLPFHHTAARHSQELRINSCILRQPPKMTTKEQCLLRTSDSAGSAHYFQLSLLHATLVILYLSSEFHYKI